MLWLFDFRLVTTRLEAVSGLLITIVAAIGVLATLFIIQVLLSVRDRRRFPPIGTLVDGSHVVRLGHGTPAVVFESGIASSSLSWGPIQSELAGETATYSYDRAGLGWSAAQGSECSLKRIAENLHALLDRLQVPRPIILVGHSFGGYAVRFYAHQYPEEVAGLVLVDAVTPQEWMEPSSEQRGRLRRAIFATRVSGILAYFGIVRFGLWLLLMRKKEKPGPLSRFSQTLQRIRSEVRKIRPDMLPQIRAHWSRPGFYWAMAAHLQALPISAKIVFGCQVPKHVSVTVLSGAHQPPERVAEQTAIATRHIIAAKSGHFVNLDEPELVITAVREQLRNCVIARQ